MGLWIAALSVVESARGYGVCACVCVGGSGGRVGYVSISTGGEPHSPTCYGLSVG
jgi:hypothetical protein